MMKLILTVVSFLMFSNLLRANNMISKGSVIISGATSLSYIDYSYLTDKNIDRLLFLLSLESGYFINDKMNLGIDVSIYDDIELNYSDSEYYNTFSLWFGPTLRYYYLKHKFNPFIHASIRIDDEFSSIMPRYGLGLDIFLNDYIALEPTLNHEMSIERRPTELNRQAISIGLGLGILLK